MSEDSMSGHLPGPWEALGSLVREKTDDYAISGKGETLGRFICDCLHPDGEPRPYDRAHALLIAAAPETAAERDRLAKQNAAMLEALKEIAEGAGPFSRDPLEHCTATVECMKETARVAIAAAEPEGGCQ